MKEPNLAAAPADPMRGIAASKPEFVKAETLEQRLDALSSEVSKTDASKDLGLLDEAISSAVKELPENPYTEYFLSANNRFREMVGGLGDVRKEVIQFTRIGRFYSMLGLNWLVTE